MIAHSVPFALEFCHHKNLDHLFDKTAFPHYALLFQPTKYEHLVVAFIIKHDFN